MSIQNFRQKTLANKVLSSNKPQGTLWVRNPTWLPMPNITSANEEVDMLIAVFPESSYMAVQAGVNPAGTYNVDWGDGTIENISNNTAANHLYDYNDPDLANTNGPVTFTDSTDTVNRTAHGYTDGMRISFDSIVTTTGITAGQKYFVINATADTFQLSATAGGSVLTLTNDGSGAILPYKQAMLKMTTTIAGRALSSLSLQLKNTTTNLQAYANPVLDMTVSANCSSLAIGGTNVPYRLMERCTILRHNTTNMANLFSNCSSLQSVPLFDTSSVTNMDAMFGNCSSLQSVPLFNTQNVTAMGSGTVSTGMFNGCSSLQSVPLFDTTKVTGMTGMFYNCSSLQSVPLFNTANVTGMAGMLNGCRLLQSVPLFNTSNLLFMGGSPPSNMFGNCSSLQSVPLFNTQNVTAMQFLFDGCSSLQSVPLFNTQNVTAMTGMFNGCSSLQSVPLFNTANVTSMGGGSGAGMFQACSSLQSVPLFDTTKVTTMGYMFNGCSSLQSVPLFNTTAMVGASAVNGFSNMFSNCPSLQQIPDINFGAGVTASGAYTSTFSSCPSLSKIGTGAANTGPKFTFSVASAKLSGNSLNTLYTSLPTVTAQTVTVSSNVGIATDDPTIATAKGWSVTGS